MSEKKLNQAISLRIAMIIEYLVINVTKEVFYNENDKILMKEIGIGYKREAIPHSYMEIIKIVKISKAIYRKILMSLFIDLEKSISKHMWNDLKF
jgi:hypothetical protein